MAAIEHRDREQVDQTEIHRKHTDEGDQAGDAKLGDLARQLGDPQRPAEFLGAAAAADHFGQTAKGVAGDHQV